MNSTMIKIVLIIAGGYSLTLLLRKLFSLLAAINEILELKPLASETASFFPNTVLPQHHPTTSATGASLYK
ncbi:hypothetical protein BH10CHL1_BH10CHL1_20350 [soil metagenome]